MFAYVGSRTTRQRDARGDGITVFRVPPDGPWEPVQVVGGPDNPSFLAFARTRPVLYAVHGDREEASAFRIGTDGLLTPLNTAPTGGRNPVHLVTTPGDRFLVVANHVTSTLAVLRLDPGTGALGEIADLLPLPGDPGPHRVEQPFAKPHAVTFDAADDLLLVPDKGLDRIFAVRVREDGRLREAAPPVVAREGSGPRHLAVSPDGRVAWVLNELDSTILACRIADRSLTPFQVTPSLPDDAVGFSRAAEIAASADGRFVYASNRGHDSIGCFAADPATGRLRPVGWVSAGGRTPRFFAIAPDTGRLFVASEDDDVITAFRPDATTGLPVAQGVVARTGSPVCIVFRA